MSIQHSCAKLCTKSRWNLSARAALKKLGQIGEIARKQRAPAAALCSHQPAVPGPTNTLNLPGTPQDQSPPSFTASFGPELHLWCPSLCLGAPPRFRKAARAPTASHLLRPNTSFFCRGSSGSIQHPPCHWKIPLNCRNWTISDPGAGILVRRWPKTENSRRLGEGDDNHALTQENDAQPSTQVDPDTLMDKEKGRSSH